VGISEGQWKLLRSHGKADAESIAANETAISVREGKVLYGIDALNRRHLLVPAGNEQVIEDHGSQGVQVGVRRLHHAGTTMLYADLVCLMPRLNSEFGHIVDDVLAALNDGAHPGSVCTNSLEKWRNLLRGLRSGELDVLTATGLFGELLVLLDLAGASPRAAEVWTGPAGGRFDFTGADAAIEVKATTRRHGRLVEISGETQLDAPSGLALYLQFVRLESVPAGGTRLRDLHASVLQAGVPRSEMRRRLEELQVDESVLASDQRCYRVLETRLYSVDAQFPKIVPGSFAAGSLPSGTFRVRYVIDLSAEPPSPLEASEREAVLRRLLARA
jgi:hypothetical protein